MTTAFQSIIKNIKQVTSKFSKTLTLHVGLLITTLERKNYSAMARSSNLSYQKVVALHLRLGQRKIILSLSHQR